MATPAQIAANRRNAQHSTGPRTEQGKAAVRLNSLTHGLRAQDAVLPGEDNRILEDLRRAFHEQYQPEGPAELFCVEKMVLSFWRNRRVAKIESDLFIGYPPNHVTGVASNAGKAFRFEAPGQDGFNRLARYEASLDRAFYRASKELQTLQKARIGFARQNEEQPAPVTEPPAKPVAPVPVPKPAEPVKRYRLDPNGKLTQLASSEAPSGTIPNTEMDQPRTGQAQPGESPAAADGR